MKIKHLLFFVSIITHQIAFCQIIKNSRLSDWHNAGFEKGNDLPSLINAEIFNLEPPTGNPVIDINNILTAINRAKLYHQTNPEKYFIIQFQSGTYRISESIKLSANENYLSYTVFRGKGCAGGPDSVDNPTTIMYVANSSNETDFIFKITGSNTYFQGNVIGYDSSSNKITLDTNPNLSPGNFLDIQFSNGSWFDSNNSSLDNYFGQVTKVKSINGNEIILEDDFSITWEYKESNNNCKLSMFIPIENIGFENFTLRFSENILNHEEGSLILFLGATNSWAKNIEGYKPIRNHISIDRSYALQISRSYFQQAHSNAGGGYGYGVAIGGRSSYCKIEDNIFRLLRHSMMTTTSANRNVFGYNYSREQYSEDNDGNIIVLGDLNLHGFHSYANLFEGNRVDRIHADSYWSSNGIYNTFLRNYTYSNSLELNSTNKSNIIGNEAEIIDDGNDNIDFYCYSGMLNHNRNNIITNRFLPIISFYLDSIPSFIENTLENNITWPPIGPSFDGISITSQNNPARLRYCSKYPSVCGNPRVLGKKVEEIKLENNIYNIEVYPNPSSSKNNIKVTLYNSVINNIIKVKLFNTTGQLIYTEKFKINNSGKQTFLLKKSNFNKGLFIIVIDTGDGNEFKEKIIIK